MSVDRLRAGEWLIAAAATALVAALFALHWYAGAHPRDGWQALPTLRWLIAVTVSVALVAALAQARPGPALAAALDVVALTLSSLTVVLLAIRLATTGAGLSAGAGLGLAGTIALVVGLVMALRAEQGWTPGSEHPIEVVSLWRQERTAPRAGDPGAARD